MGVMSFIQFFLDVWNFLTLQAGYVIFNNFAFMRNAHVYMH